MALKIRMRKQGRNNRPFYRIVLADARAPRDGKYLETLGWYNPFEEEQEKMMSIHEERIDHWLKQGAEISDNVEIIVKKLAPTLFLNYRAKREAKQSKLCAKRREFRKKAAQHVSAV